MPMFYTPKPRQFHYTPRFYDPEKEKWEEIKRKYSEERTADSGQQSVATDAELEYFERKVRDIEDGEKQDSRKLGFKDLFRRRKMPTFNYQPRFQAGASGQAEATEEQSSISADNAVIDKYTDEAPAAEQGNRTRKIKIRRRFDISDTEYMKPVSGGKIIIYALLACLLLYFILF
jgi:hypothetical protein